MTTVPISINNKTTKVKRLREGGFCVFCFFFKVLFCCGSFFLHFCQAQKVFNHQEFGYYPQRKIFFHNFDFD
jgi:hypothetical protein